MSSAEVHATSVVPMANQIAAFFASQGDHDVAVAGTADHIKAFWAPVMRRDLLALVDAGEAHRLSAIARDAILRLR
jgi:formate dehydrogenase subunit delta